MGLDPPQTTLFVDFYIQPELIETWKAAHRPVWYLCAQEPKCLLFDVFEDPEDLGHFKLVEVLAATKTWFVDEQMSKPYYAELWKNSEHTYRKPREILFMERLGQGSSYRSVYLDAAMCMDGDRVQQKA